MEVNHSANQKDYVNWKYNILKSIVKSGPKLRNGNGNRIACRFYTRCLPEVTELFNRFYQDKQKIIPSNLSIDDLSLAVWFMDDGSKSRNTLYLNTQQFSHEEQIILQDLLKSRFGINSTLNKDKIYERIRIVSADAKKFCEIIRPYVIQTMAYKLV